MTLEPGLADPWILAIDTGTSQIIVAGGNLDGSAVRVLREPAGFRHGELLLLTIDRLLSGSGLTRERLRAIVVGTGPGGFTGLRVGLATAKTMAHAMGLPIIGVSTAVALLHAAARQSRDDRADVRPAVPASTPLVLLLPAGPRDRLIVRDGLAPRLVVDDADHDEIDVTALVAVDLEGRAPDRATTLGRAAQQGLGAALLEIGAERLRLNQLDDPELLVPDYVTLPRGIRDTIGAIEWSNDPP